MPPAECWIDLAGGKVLIRTYLGVPKATQSIGEIQNAYNASTA
jgi:hypothetical protein